MAFQTPPTFVDGAVLSASQLNILVENQNYLSGIAAGVNVGFMEAYIARATSQTYHVVHSHNNLFLIAYIPDADTKIEVYYDSGSGNVLVYSNLPGAAGTITVNDDLSPHSLTLGTRYTVEVSCRDRSGGSPAGTLILRYLAESAAAL